ncbi:unnamed protein product, partial [Candidula unifasciata]
INHHNATGTMDDVVEEYAIIHKTKDGANHVVGDQEQGSEDKEFFPYGVSPPEPPRLYTVLDTEEDANDIPKHKTKYKYSQITARESIASMSARTSENPYESLPDSLDNTYTRVEGSLVEEIETVHRAGGLGGANRISQISDTYAEIGISGGSVKYNSINRHLADDKKIVLSTTTASLLHPVNQVNGQHIYSNSSQSRQNYIASAGVSGSSSNHHENIPEYKNSGDTYVTLNEESSSLSAAESQGILHLSNSSTIQGQGSGSRTVQEVKGYDDYEDVGETKGNGAHSKPKVVGNKADTGVEHKKVGQRRAMLDHK